jgi:hypothetical protein
MDNGLLYTYSTIAQALGGAFALLAACVLYRLQSLQAGILDDAAIVRAIVARSKGDCVLFDSLLVQRKYPELIELVNSTVAKGIVMSESEGLYLVRTRASGRLQTALLRTFKSSALMTGGLMAVSVALIPYVHLFSSCEVLSLTVATLGVIAFALCLWLYWRVMKAALYGE